VAGKYLDKLREVKLIGEIKNNMLKDFITNIEAVISLQ
jgi:hypothetical protein